MEAADGRVPVVAGTGPLDAREHRESASAERSGAAAAYDPPSWPELLAHYSAVADRISIPIMYYNIPSASGVSLTTDQLSELRRRAR